MDNRQEDPFQQIVSQLKKYLSERTFSVHNPFDFERTRFINSLIKICETDESPASKAHQLIIKITNILIDPSKFSGKNLRTLLEDIQKKLLPIRFLNAVEEKEKINFDKINEAQVGAYHKTDDYFYKKSLDDWIEFYNLTNVKHSINENSLGWKFHISFDRTDLKNAREGTDIVLKHLMANNIDSFKLMPLDKKITDRSNGKDITIYASDSISSEEWQKILSEIESELDAAGIKAGASPIHSEPVKNSKFIHYRNDINAKGEYTQNDFNASGQPNRFKDLKIEHIVTLKKMIG